MNNSIVAIFIVLFIVFYTDSSNKVIDYQRSCEQINTSADDCQSWNYSKSVYYVNINTQQVFFEGSYGPVPYSDCYVATKNYWYCGNVDSDIPNLIANQNGKFTEEKLFSRNFTIEHYSNRFKYWFNKLLN